MPLTYSIVIPTKDRPALLRRAVTSAFAAIDTSGEIIVVDDASRIPAQDVLKEVADERLKIVSIRDAGSGVATARNAGIAQARGDLIFFLDDDDEIIADYCTHVLQHGATGHAYGFSCYLMARDDGARTKPGRVRFSEGTIATDAPMKRQLCGFGMGFWIWREVAQQTGAVQTDLSINEDTEYLCRLITAGRRGWYSAKPGVILHSHSGGADGIGHLTDRSTASERARCMRVVCDKYPQMALHLGSGYVRHCLKTDAETDAWQFIKSQSDWRVRNWLRLFATYKTLVYWLSRRGGTA